ncbi:MAG TPA: GGDEF domain-containing protein [Dehalococcoidia bacterium]|nr:GGDEF domain-containing protein [Dehalococcoidia bacterium]
MPPSADFTPLSADTGASEQRGTEATAYDGANLIATLDARGQFRFVSPAAAAVLNRPPAELAGSGGLALIHPKDRAHCAAAYVAVLARPGAERRVEARVRIGDGWRPLELVFTNLLDQPSVQGVALSVGEFPWQPQRREEPRPHACHDAVTGLPNRALFYDRLQQACLQARAAERALALVLVDIDRFRAVNDQLGVACGDRLLAEVARRLEWDLREVDTLARLGGDEFAIVLEAQSGPAGPRRVAERIVEALRPPFCIDGRVLSVTASIGIALAAGMAATTEELMQQADVALYQAKAEGRASYVVFDPRIDGPARDRLRLESELRSACEREELRLHYQPEIDLRSGCVVGVEALVRWQHPHRGLLEPAAFVPVAEATDLICEIDRWVLARACEQAARWCALRPELPFVLSVNLSARQLLQASIVADVALTLQRSGLAPDCLRLEVTESAVIGDLDAATRALHGLSRLGVQLAVDDFGTGYSSLAYLRRFPVTTLKIDREFSNGLDGDASAETVLQAVASLGHGLGMQVTLEGVETLRQVEIARQVRCDRAQGNYFWAPLPGEAIAPILGAGA